jgi:hypothetical protein
MYSDLVTLWKKEHYHPPITPIIQSLCYFRFIKGIGGCPRIAKLSFSTTGCNGRGNPAPTLTRSAYTEFGTIRGLFIIVKVGARSPRPHLVDVFSDSLLVTQLTSNIPRSDINKKKCAFLLKNESIFHKMNGWLRFPIKEIF